MCDMRIWNRNIDSPRERWGGEGKKRKSGGRRMVDGARLEGHGDGESGTVPSVWSRFAPVQGKKSKYLENHGKGNYFPAYLYVPLMP